MPEAGAKDSGDEGQLRGATDNIEAGDMVGQDPCAVLIGVEQRVEYDESVVDEVLSVIVEVGDGR